MFRIFQSVTARFVIIILVLAFLTAMTLYQKETASVVQTYANGGWSGYSLTEKEAAHFRQAAYWYFLIFCMPLIPLFICVGRKDAQVAITVLSLVALGLALSASPGGDQKGCEDCFLPIIFSGASTIFSIVAALGVAGASIFRFLTRSSRK